MDRLDELNKRLKQPAKSKTVPSSSPVSEHSEPAPPEPWPELIPLDQQEPPPAFPLEVYTDNVRWIIDTVTKDTRASIDYAAGAVLSTAAAAIGGTCRAVGKGKWSEQPALWICIVGLPSEKKTPSASIIQSPLFAANEKRIRTAKQRDKDHKALGNDTGPEPRIYGNDEGLILMQTCTTEGLVRALQRQRRGVLYTRSELTGWLEGLNQYKSGKGDDRQTYLELYDGKSITKQLASELIHCPNVCFNMFGGMQPAVVEKFTHVSDGLDARILPIYPACRVASQEDWHVANPDRMKQWKGIVGNLLRLQLTEEKDDDGEPYLKPRYYKMDQSAKEVWETYTAWGASLQNSGDEPPKVREWLGKHEGFGLRIAITLRKLAEADGEACKEYTLTAIDIERSMCLMQYFYRMVRRLYGAFNCSPEDDLVKRAIAWIKKEKRTEFTRKECWKPMCGSVDSPSALLAPFSKLTDYGYIRPGQAQIKRGPGRPAEVWEANPALFRDGE